MDDPESTKNSGSLSVIYVETVCTRCFTYIPYKAVKSVH